MHTMGHSNYQTFQRFYRNKKVSKDTALEYFRLEPMTRDRTGDLTLTKRLLYHLSYIGDEGVLVKSTGESKEMFTPPNAGSL